MIFALQGLLADEWGKLEVTAIVAADALTVLPMERFPERRRGLQLLLGVVLYAVCQVAVTIGAVVAFAATTSGATSATVGEILSSDGAAPAIGFGVGAVVAVVGFVVVVRFVSGRPPRELMGPSVLPELAWGLVIGAGIVALSVAVLGIAGIYQVGGVQLSAAILSGLMFGVGPAIVEEVFFRGFLLRLFDNWFGSWVAVIVVSLVFALVHGLSSPAGPAAALFVFVSASLMLNMAYLLTRRLWLPIALHLAFNATQGAVFGFSVSGNSTGSSLVIANIRGPSLLTGGEMGLEGSVVLLVIALIVGVVMTLFAVRRNALLKPVRVNPAPKPSTTSAP